MAQPSPQKLPRGKASSYTVIYLSDQKLVTPLLTGLTIATCNPSVETDVTPPPSVQRAAEGIAENGDKLHTVSTRMSCNFCTAVFSNRTEQKTHFKSDWHRFNLKQHIKGEKAITEDQFEAMTGDVSSISGSDDTSTSTSDDESTPAKAPSLVPGRKKSKVYESSDSTDSEAEENMAVMAATRRHPKVFLKNAEGQLLSLYRSVLYHKKTAPNTPAELLSLAEQAKTYTRVAMVMLAGGHFSAAVFDGTEAVVHKTFHRYVVRAKRGTVQSVRDGQGSAPKSGGASLRRYNEAALAQEIQELLSSWSEHLKGCHLIFLRTSTYSRHIFFGGKAPIFSKDDLRVRTVPFTTGRPTFNEAKRVHHMLMAVECFGEESLVKHFVPVSPPRHLHPDTGHLVVRPNSAKNKPRGKDRKADGDQARGKDKPEKEAEEIGLNTDTTAASNKTESADDNQSEGEIQLVETMTEMSTNHLQEYACSVSVPKRNKKKKKKSSQKEEGGEATGEQRGDANVQTSKDQQLPELSEEEVQLKNQLYTLCRSGDTAQLSTLLKELRSEQSYSWKGKTSIPQGNASSHDTLNHSNKEEQDFSGSLSESCLKKGSPQTSGKCDSRGTCTSNREENQTHCPAGDNTESEHSSKTVLTVPGNNSTSNPENIPTDTDLKLSVIGNESKSTPESCGVDKDSDPSTVNENTSESTPENSGDDKSIQLSASHVSERERFEHVLGKYGAREQSLLHVAATAGHGDVITLLLESGCDPALRDAGGKTPYCVATNKDVRNAFRRFRGTHPEQYDYEAAQIPSGLTADMEAERKQKEAEKKKAQKKAKQERLKDRKMEEAREKAEQREKDRFLALSDREKRALAAEKRLLANSTPASVTPVLNRCYQCGVDISGKVPFVYMEFQFCSPKCLKEHRLKHTSSK